MSETCRVIIADGNADIRSALRFLVEQEGDMEVVAEASSSRALLRQLSLITADILLLDAAFPTASPPAGIELLRWDHPNLAVIILSPEACSGTIPPPGACCLISKKDSPESVRQALRAARDKHRGAQKSD